MSEFYFDYACHPCDAATESKENSQPSFRFVPFQDFEKQGEMCIQVIPSFIPENTRGLYLYYVENGIDSPRAFDASILRHCSDGFISRAKLESNGSFFIYSPKSNAIDGIANLSGCGIFGFAEKEGEAPSIENSYHFSVNFCLKQEIFYVIRVKKRKLEVNVSHPPLSEPMTLLLCSEYGKRPLKKAYRKGTEVARITLEAGKVTYARVLLDNTLSTEYGFRLFFENEEDSKYYLLSDNSLRGGKEKEARYYDDVVRKRGLRCPYCFGPLLLPEKFGKGASHTICRCSVSTGGTGVRADVPYDVASETFVKNAPARHIIYCDKDYVSDMPKVGNNVDGQEIGTFDPMNYQNLVIPEDYIHLPAMNLAFIGSSNSGKSVTISSFLGVHSIVERLDGAKVFSRPSCGFQIPNAILSCFASRYSGNSVKLAPYTQLKFSSREETMSLTDVSIDSSVFQETEKHILDKYFLDVGKGLSDHTKPEATAEKSLHPFIVHMEGCGYIFAFDIAGELFTNCDKGFYLKHMRGVENADGLYLVVDAYDREHLKASIENAMETLNTIEREFTAGRMNGVPIAVVLTKFDMQSAFFDENCFVQREHFLAKDRVASPKYKNSWVQHQIECSSEEIEEFLLENGGENFIKKIKCYKYYKFFAVSSLGASDRDICTEKKIHGKKDPVKVLNYAPRPLRTELPIVWLMYQNGLIRR